MPEPTTIKLMKQSARSTQADPDLRDEARLAAVHATALLDSPAEDAFDRHTRLARRLLNAAAAIVTLVDATRVFAKSAVIAPGAQTTLPRQVPIADSFCPYTVASAALLLVNDSRLDARFRDHSAVVAFNVIAYAGVPLVVDGHALGTFCVVDSKPRAWTEDDVEILHDLAAAVTNEIVLRNRVARHTSAEARLAAQQQTLRLAMAAGRISTFAWDVRHNQIAWSENLERQLGLAPGSFGGTFEAFMALVHADDRARVQAELDRVYVSGGDYRCEFRMLRPDGSVRWTESHATLERDGHGELVRLIGVDVDITERKAAESARDAERARLTRLLAAAQVGITRVNSRGEILDVNDAFLRLTGYSFEELRTLGWAGITPPGYEARDRESNAALARTGIVNAYEKEYMRKDGSRITVMINGARSDPNVDEHTVFVVDITAQKYAQLQLKRLNETLEQRIAERTAELREANGFNRQIIVSAQEGIQVYDHDGRCVLWNPFMEKVSGYQAEQVLGKRAVDVFHFLSEGSLETFLDRAWRGEVVEAPDLSYGVPETGVEGWNSVRFAPLRNAQGDIIGVIVMARDITQRKHAEQKLQAHRVAMEQLQQRLIVGQTVAAVAHELNQPLNAITSYNEAALRLLRAGNPNPDKLSHALERSAAQALRAGQTMHDLLALLQVHELKPEPMDLVETVRRAIDAFLPEGNGGFVPTLDAPASLPQVQAIPMHVEKVLLNLLRNAAEAMQNAGLTAGTLTVTVCRSADEHFIQISVRDGGPGVSAEMVRDIFEPFYTTKARGVGMGLAVARALIQARGGTLWADADVGSGACFHFTVPLVP